VSTFAERYCERFHVHPSDFEVHVLRRAFYPAARLLSSFVSIKNDFFIPDREFVRMTAELTTPKKFFNPADEFMTAPENRSFIRRRLRLRVSVRRLRSLVHEAFAENR